LDAALSVNSIGSGIWVGRDSATALMGNSG